MAWKEFLSWAINQGIVIKNEKEIPYGKQVRLEKNGEQVPFSWYTSGKVSIQGKEGSLKQLVSQYWGKATEPKNQTSSDEENYYGYIGSDESGKGDYFGPLVVANAFIPEGQEEKLVSLGVKDSKKLSASKIMELAKEIKKICEYESIVLMPIEYNYIYKQEKNLNRIMVKLHTDINTSLAKKVKARGILIDQFTSQDFLLKNSLKNTGLNIVQKFRAEAFLPVACASIIARSLFVEAMDSLSDQWGVYLPKGASLEVETTARNFIEKHGEAKMSEVAKLHFVTSEKIGIKGYEP